MTYLQGVLGLRSRLLLVAIFATATVLTVLVMMASVVRGSLARRLPDARAHLADLTDSAARDVALDALVSRLDDGALGYCARDGSIFGDASRVPGEAGRGPRPLPHDQLEVVARLCRDTGDDPRVAEVVHPHDIVSFRATAAGANRVAWGLVRTPLVDPAAERRWTSQVVLLGGIVLLLVVTASSALIAFGRGVRDLEAALATLRGDLRADLALPKTSEFAALTIGLKEMARYLADARERERSLERDLAHRERLAGLGRVVAGVAHEIRNPLAGIKLKLDVMARDESTSPGQRTEIASCLEEVVRLDRVVQSLLTVARKREPHRPSSREPIALLPLVTQRAELHQRSAPAAVFDLDVAAELAVLGDRDDLTRILDNLLANAVDATHGAGRITVSARIANGQLALRVEDDGPGVDTEIASRLFTPFTSTKPTGLGMGLWLSRALAEANGGSLIFEGGSVLVLKLEAAA